MNYQIQFEEIEVIDEISMLAAVQSDIEKIPEAETQFLPGIKWGAFGELFTPAYWKAQYLMFHQEENFTINYKLGSDILEEVVACLLGGFGLKSELGLAAFNRLKERSLITAGVRHEDILLSLSDPFLVNGKLVRYRFPNQKAKYITQFLCRSDLGKIPSKDDIELRDWLLLVNGIGPKTASWITRNFLGSEKVAIIDIHIFRACQMMGIYSKNHDVQKDYSKLEQLFLNFCFKLGVQPSKMDALIWMQMKLANREAIRILNKI